MHRNTVVAAAVLAVLAGGTFIAQRHAGTPPADAAMQAVLGPLAPNTAHGAGAPTLVRRPAELHCIALAVYHEARGEPPLGQAAVAQVVLNRAEHPDFPDTPCAVVRQGGEEPPCQFSWWCDGRNDTPRDPEAWATALRVAEATVRAPEADPTRGAVYFHRTDVHPDWRTKFQRTVTLGRHAYYADPPEIADGTP